jgi:hypothetical protein
MRVFKLEKSANSSKKFAVYEILNGSRSKVINFGAAGYQDFTIHKDPTRKTNYLARHAPNQDWTESGLMTAGFWARWLLWNKPTVISSAQDIAERFGIKIVIG